MKLLCVVVLGFFVCLFGHTPPSLPPRPFPSGLSKQSNEKGFFAATGDFFSLNNVSVFTSSL